MDKIGQILIALWVIILLALGIVGGGVAHRQYQIWKARDKGDRIAAGILALVMVGVSLHGFLWIVALTLLGDLKPPKSFTITMMAAETALSIPIWLWLAMLLGLVHDGPTLIPKKILSGEQPPEFWLEAFRQIVREEVRAEINRPFKEDEK